MSVTCGCRGPTGALGYLLLVGLALGCGDDEPAGGGGNGGEGGQPTGGAPQGGGGAGAGGGGAQGGGGGVMLEEFNDVASGRTPFDATPNQDGSVIFFTGEDPAQGAGVFQVPSTGGTVAAVATGDPFVAPFGIATATAGDLLYVADPAADEPGDDRGLIISVNATNGETNTLVTGFSPLALEVFDQSGEDTIYFTGRNLSGEAGVFTVGDGGGAVTEVVAGAPIVDASGIAISSVGDVYFVDTVGSGARTGRVLLLELGAGPPVVLVDNLSVGYPAGLALSLDNTELWVSGLDTTTGTDVLLRVDVATQAVTSYTGDADTSIATFEEAAGIHRAKNADIFSFVDSRAGGTGTVFALQP